MVNNDICPKCGIKFAIYDVRESATTVNDPDGSIIKYHIKHGFKVCTKCEDVIVGEDHSETSSHS